MAWWARLANHIAGKTAEEVKRRTYEDKKKVRRDKENGPEETNTKKKK